MKKSHYFRMRVTFDRAVTRREALAMVNNSAHMGRGSDDYYIFWRDGHKMVEGKMRVSALSLAKPEKPQ